MIFLRSTFLLSIYITVNLLCLFDYFLRLLYWLDRLLHQFFYLRFFMLYRLAIQQIIIDARAIPEIDVTAAEQLRTFVKRLHERGIPVIVTSGYEVLPRPPGKAVAVLQKPFGEAQLLALLRPLTSQKAAE